MAASKKQKLDVLIVGGGPTGVMAACELARCGLSFRIVDAEDSPTTESRAFGIHSAQEEVPPRKRCYTHILRGSGPDGSWRFRPNGVILQ